MLIFEVFQKFLTINFLVFLLLLIGLVLGKKKNKEIFYCFLFIFILFFSLSPIADLISLPLEKQYSQIKKEDLKKSDKIVLLLGGEETDILRSTEALRIYHYKKTNNEDCKIIISGKDPFDKKTNEGENLKIILEEEGVFQDDIILEQNSKNTYESAKNIKEILKDEPFFLVTSDIHMPRSIEVFQKLNLFPIPAPFEVEKRNYSYLDFLPHPKAFLKTENALYEYLAILYYRLRYY